MSLSNDIYGGTYSVDQIANILQNMNSKEKGTLKPSEAFYQKSMNELGPSHKQRRDLVSYLINESNMTAISKNYLMEAEQ